MAKNGGEIPKSPRKVKKRPENEAKEAGEGMQIPAVAVTPPTPEKPPKETPKSPDQEKVAEEEPAEAALVTAEEKKEEPKEDGTQGGEKEKATTPPPPPPPPTPKPARPGMSLKMAIRMETWNRLEAENLVLFPRPCWRRIPRFKGENEAVERLAKLDVFKDAKLVKVNLDKAHERLRLEIIRSGKELVAGTPGLREAVFLVMHPPMDPSPDNNKNAASRNGIHFLGTALDFQAKQANLVVLGSVAVDKKGHRIGKAEGFSDLEFALLSKLGTIPADAVIATLVHDVQVYEEFPESIFEPYDVPVDIIITPTRVIEVEKKLTRPVLRWDCLSKRRIDEIPIVKQLLDKERASGADIELKEDTDTESKERFPEFPRRKRFMPQRRQATRQLRGPRVRGSSAPPPNWGTRTYRREPRRQTLNSSDSTKSERLSASKSTRTATIRRHKPRYTVDFSLKVNGLSNAVRIRDLKAALVERGVRPADISWRATKGVALLHFAKRRELREPIMEKNVDEVVASLQGLTVTPEDGPKMDLSVEVAALAPKPKTLDGPKPAQGPRTAPLGAALA